MNEYYKIQFVLKGHQDQAQKVFDALNAIEFSADKPEKFCSKYQNCVSSFLDGLR